MTHVAGKVTSALPDTFTDESSGMTFGLRHRIDIAKAVLVISTLLAAGCATTEFVSLRHKPRNVVTERLSPNWLGRIRHSERTGQFLVQTAYAGPADLKPMIQHTRRQQDVRFAREAAFAESELCYLAADAARPDDWQLACELYLDGASAAWCYLTTTTADGTIEDPNTAGHREAAELYNTCLESLLRLARDQGQVLLGQSIRMPLSGRSLRFEIPFASPHLTHDQLSEFEFVSDYEIKNLTRRHTTAGLGVPIIAVRKRPQRAEPVEQYYPQGMSFAATLLLRFDGPSHDPSSGGVLPASQSTSPAQRRGFAQPRLQIFDPRESDGVVVQNTLLPLETDVSTPLARYLTNPDISLLDTWAFLRPDRAEGIAGLYMVQPYDPDRIPVLMVHGVWSSPMTWMEMFNELQADPEIRRRYQFWFYLYPTGEPLAFTAAGLRDELQRVRMDCDPQHENDRLDEMVVVGHSMGGLISHMLTLNSGDRLWRAVSGKPVDQLTVSARQRDEIQRVFFFQANPSIDRVITIASPYRGSSLSNRFTRWLGRSVVWLPSRTYELTRVIFEQNGLSWWERIRAPRTSLDSLTKESGVLRLVSESPIPADVRHHNIVGVKRGSDIGSWTDGVVAFRSAHCEDVHSEKVIKAGHSEILRHPETVAEVRRVLLEHLEESRRRRFPVIPASREAGNVDPVQSASRAMVP